MIKIVATLLLLSFWVDAKTPAIVAHRGASQDAPENTIPAFKLAWEQGADAIEGDFFLTKDNHIVCIHDPNTKKVATRNLEIKKSTLAELRTLDVGVKYADHFKGTSIPLISEVFATVPAQKKMIYIEIKCGTEIIPPLLKEIGRSGLKQKQIVIISFNHKVIEAMKIKAPQYKAFWLSGMERDRSGKPNPSLETVLSTLKKINADGFSSHHRHIDKKFIRELIDKGYEYHVWTVDDAKTAARFQQWGATSITTNVPAHIQKSIAK
ncbi:glycerophosphodiester phosphodiesterase [Verrucomicrobiaceae bacterium N1E253]|uniref:Glycerophosphodiester phosphodiesterase n=1 Tax=Oceaniferula marina TaxID=2748318 RepID=A0A851GLW2_9BACT|nr:glycerophosphodiester phosphodiesterase [Oceaniferula marina]NWK55770.1 glycerophosphodiester phosphodiesterase [Oceaniferula marina]